MKKISENKNKVTNLVLNVENYNLIKKNQKP